MLSTVCGRDSVCGSVTFLDDWEQTSLWWYVCGFSSSFCRHSSIVVPLADQPTTDNEMKFTGCNVSKVNQESVLYQQVLSWPSQQIPGLVHKQCRHNNLRGRILQLNWSGFETFLQKNTVKPTASHGCTPCTLRGRGHYFLSPFSRQQEEDQLREDCCPSIRC